MSIPRILAAIILLLFTATARPAFAQAKLDYRQQKELTDAEGYIDEAAALISDIEASLKTIKPGDPAVPIQTIQQHIANRDRAVQRLGYAKNRFKTLPADNADVKIQTDRLPAIEASLASLETRLADLKNGLQKVVDQGAGAGYKADFDRLKEINQMFADDQLLDHRPETAIEVVRQIPAIKAERIRIAEKYADLMKQDTPASRDMKNILAFFDERFGIFDKAASTFAAEAPAKIEASIAEALKMGKEAVDGKKHLFFGPDGGVNQHLREAQSRLDVLAAYNASAAAAPAAKLKAARAQIITMQASLLDEIVKSNPIPEQTYNGPDAAELVNLIKQKWATAGVKSEVLKAGINSNNWQRTTRWEWNANAWRKVDQSWVQGFIIIKTSDTLAAAYYIDLVKNHLNNDQITASFFDDPKEEPPVTHKLLLTKIK